MDSARLLVYFKKFFFVLGLGSTVGDVIMGACLLNFMADVTWPCTPTQWAIFWFKFFLESRLSSTSSEPLIGFLAYLQSKLWPKKQKLVKILLPQSSTLGILYPWPTTCQQNELKKPKAQNQTILNFWGFEQLSGAISRGAMWLDVHFFVVYITGGYLCIFVYIWMTSTSQVDQSSWFHGSKFYWILLHSRP